jgi:hypothetical protein
MCGHHHEASLRKHATMITQLAKQVTRISSASFVTLQSLIKPTPQL